MKLDERLPQIKEYQNWQVESFVMFQQKTHPNIIKIGMVSFKDKG